MSRASFTTARGVPVFVEPSHELPLVDVEVVLRQGAVFDPAERPGLTRLAARLMRRGPRGMTPEAFDEAIDALGATLAVAVYPSTIRVSGTVIRRNLEAFLTLLGRMLARPALTARELERQRRKTLAELTDLRDHDRSLAALAFRRALFGTHPYGRTVTGNARSVGAITKSEVEACLASLVTTGNLIVGIAGDVTIEQVAPLLDRAFAALPDGAAVETKVPAPRARKGRHITVVDKPERSQTQLYVGTLGARMGQDGYYPLLVADTGFGGTFTSRLVREVRSERGWSYGAHSKLSADRQRDTWTVWTHPASEQLVDCLKLELDLIRGWADAGLSADELGRAKSFLVKSYAFDVETAHKRLEPRLLTELYGLPASFLDDYVRQVQAVDLTSAKGAVGQFLPVEQLTIALVATATEPLVRALEGLAESVTVVDVSSVAA